MTAYSLVIATKKSYKFPKKISSTMSSICVPKFYFHSVWKVSSSVSRILVQCLSRSDRSHDSPMDFMECSLEHRAHESLQYTPSIAQTLKVIDGDRGPVFKFQQHFSLAFLTCVLCPFHCEVIF